LPTARGLRSFVIPVKRRAPVVAVCALASVVLVACGPDDRESSAGTVDTVPAPLTGQEIFAMNCAVCHGAEGEGQPNWHIAKDDGTLPAPPLNGDGHTWHHPDGLLYRIVSRGGAQFESPSDPSFKSGMPGFEDRLNHEEIVSVLTYVKSLWGDKVRMDFSIRESQALLSERDPFPPAGE
jgi:mono/diheme cytochrome c family protein